MTTVEAPPPERPIHGQMVLLRVRELEALSALSANPGARIYIGFDKHLDHSLRAGE